jgi:hypothetical protein
LPLQATLAAEKKTGIFKLHGRVAFFFCLRRFEIENAN